MPQNTPFAGQGRNLVLCCDGTSNQYCDRNTNVVKLSQVLVKGPNRQLCFYDPGVGTFSAPAFFTKIGKAFSRLLGLAFGWGITQNIEDDPPVEEVGTVLTSSSRRLDRGTAWARTPTCWQKAKTVLGVSYP